jgi:hypothetical protein
MDTNFRLRCKIVGSEEDLPLGSGWAYFVEKVAYKLHLQNYGNQNDVNDVLPSH